MCALCRVPFPSHYIAVVLALAVPELLPCPLPLIMIGFKTKSLGGSFEISILMMTSLISLQVEGVVIS